MHHIVSTYQVPFYPLPPLLVIAIATMVVISALRREPLYCGLALGFVALSVPVHWVLVRLRVLGNNASTEDEVDNVLI